MVFMPHWPHLLGKKPIDLGLERIEALLAALGSPHLHLPPMIHVAGTNGKGSTIAFLKHILQAAGYKVDIYTSPHLVDFNERISLNGQPIDDDTLHQVMEECRIACEATNIPVTFFEGTTAGAFLAFSRSQADILLLETGLGGRLDATNVIPNPAITIITSISYDHMEYLGPTLSLIAGEKAGIMKKGTTCISSLQEEEVELVLEQQAENVGCDLLAFGYDWHSEWQDDQLLFHDHTSNLTKLYPKPALLGNHQIINAGNAIAAIKHLKDFKVSDEAIAQGLTNTTWPARLQPITSGRLISRFLKNTDWELWVDGAHNQAGAYSLSENLRSMPPKPLYLITGMTKGRDVKDFLSHFVNDAQLVAGILIETEPSAYPAHIVAEQAASLGIKSFACDNIEHAIDIIMQSGNKPGRILCTGSLYLASDLFKANKS